MTVLELTNLCIKDIINDDKHLNITITEAIDWVLKQQNDILVSFGVDSKFNSVSTFSKAMLGFLKTTGVEGQRSNIGFRVALNNKKKFSHWYAVSTERLTLENKNAIKNIFGILTEEITPYLNKLK